SNLAGELLVCRGDAGYALKHGPIGLEETAQEGSVDGWVICLQDRGGDPRSPALADMIGPGQLLGEPCGLPPSRQAHRLQGDLAVPLLCGHRRREAEEFLGDDAEPFHDVKVAIGHAQPDALRMKAAVTHEVPNELGQLRRDRVRYLESVIPCVVRLIK